MIISPTEPDRLKALGTVAWKPEEYGADVMWSSRGRLIGVQRKEIMDLVSSVADGRIGQQVIQMQRLDVAAFVVEGEPRWTNTGEMMNCHGRGLSPQQWQSVLWTVAGKGILVDFTRNLQGTIDWLKAFEAYQAKERHDSLMKRSGPVSMWGRLENMDYCRHLVMGLPGVGTELANRIIEKFGVPFGWKVTREELLTVEGLGIKKVDKIMAALGTVDGG